MKGDPRYTSNTVFDSFPWPQNPTLLQVRAIALLSVELRNARREIMQKHRLSLRDLYRIVETSPNNHVSKLQERLDNAVRLAYGMKKDADILSFLLNLNLELFEKENRGDKIVGPGLPPIIENPLAYISVDCVSMD
jgi:hypothetical protein